MNDKNKSFLGVARSALLASIPLLRVAAAVCALALAVYLVYSIIEGTESILTLVACALMCVFLLIFAHLCLNPDTLRSQYAEQTLSIASEMLEDIRDGLTPESAEAICRRLLPETRAMTIAVTDRERVLACVGALAEQFPPGSPIHTPATRYALDHGLVQSFTNATPTFSDSLTAPPIPAGIIAPLKVRGKSVGTLKFYFSSPHAVNRTQYALVSGFAELISTQLATHELERQDELTARAELRALQAQINPHFLFNTLQSVANMAGIEQATVTGDMVVRLANFFRYTLDHDDSVVTLDRELALLRDYISLQELRFGERISFEMDCDSRCAACELPKFTLQPIVENSIVHGMRSRSAGGRIRIVTQLAPEGCRIQITDNGGGFSRSKMKQNTAEGHRSIGLQNIAGRIALSGGSFRIVSCPGLGTTARIILPMKGEEHIC